MQLQFSKTHIGLIGGYNYYFQKNKKKNSYFLLNRADEKGKEVGKQEFIAMFGNKTINVLSSYPNKKTLSASDGTTYKLIPDGDCKWKEVLENSEVVDYTKVNSRGLGIQQLSRNGKTINTDVNACNGRITALEHANGNLFIGTGDFYEKGHGPAQGLFIQKRDNSKPVKSRIKMEDWTSVIRLDPYAGKVWVVASYALYAMDNNGDQIKKYRFYHDFDHDTGLPRIYISKAPVITNPFSLVARSMTKKNQRAFYEEAKKIPKEHWSAFNLYSFFMCCNIDQTIYPASLNNLAPFLIKELEEIVQEDSTTQYGYIIQNQKYRSWLQTLCRFDDPRVLKYLKSENNNEGQSKEYQKIDTYLDDAKVMEKKMKNNQERYADNLLEACIKKLEK